MQCPQGSYAAARLERNAEHEADAPLDALSEFELLYYFPSTITLSSYTSQESFLLKRYGDGFNRTF